MKLVFTVLPVSYQSRYESTSPLPASKRKIGRKGLSKQQSRYNYGKNAKQIASILEAKYGIISEFVKLEQNFIKDLMDKDIARARRNGNTTNIISEDTLKKIEAKFRSDLDNQAFNGLLRGVPTIASLKGVNHSLQHPYARRGSRPSFVDTGLFKYAFRIKVEK